MNVYTVLMHGLGDQVSCHLHDRPSARPMARMMAGFRNGTIDRIGVVANLEHRPNPAALEVFAALGIQSRSWEDVKGWTDARELPPLDPDPFPARLPIVQPTVAVPRNFVLFNQLAGGVDRCLDDPSIYDAIKQATRLPIVKVGRTRPAVSIDPIPCDLDLTDKTTVPQSFWLAKHAACIIAPCSWMRNMTWGFGTPVIELVQAGRVNQETMDRTNAEYARKAYGMCSLNFWCTWPNAKDDFIRALGACMERRKTDGPIPTSLWPTI